MYHNLKLECFLAKKIYRKRWIATIKDDILCFLSGSNGVHSVTVSPQSMCSSGADSGVDSYDLPSMAISLCGGLTENREITKGAQTQSAPLINHVQQDYELEMHSLSIPCFCIIIHFLSRSLSFRTFPAEVCVISAVC